MNKRRYRKTSLFVAFLLFVSSIAVVGVGGATPGNAGNDEIMDQLLDDPEVSGNITKPFLEVTNFRSDGPVVYMDEDNTLYVTVVNTGGSTGDKDYIEDINWTMSQVDMLKNDTDSRAAEILLGKTFDSLNDTLIDISEGERVNSFKHILKAMSFLQAAGKKGIDTENLFVFLADTVQSKVNTVVEEAERSFGSKSQDVTKGKIFYLKGVQKLDEEKYIPAVAMFKQSFKKSLKAYECDVDLSLTDVVHNESETDIGDSSLQDLKAEEEGALEFVWHPVERGVHYIGFNMTGDYMVYNSLGEVVSSSPFVLTAAFPVSPRADEKYIWDTPEERTISPDDPHTPTTFPTQPDWTCEIEVMGGDVIIEKDATLTFNEGVTFTIENPDYDPHECAININSGGTFTVDA
ncbi:MAG: hypothetical protein R6U61_04760 [Thermoplasmata archaeon]